MPANSLLRHKCDSAKIARVAYDPDARRLYVEFKPKMSAYAYEGIDASHFQYIQTCKFDERLLIVEELEQRDAVAALGVTPGSEGSYIVRVIVGTDRKNPPFPFRRLDDIEAAEIFPFESQESAA